MTEIERIASIAYGEHRRKLRPEKVRELADSIRTLGLLHPVTIAQEGSRLVAGLHRLKACESLGWAEIPVIRLTGSDLDAELAEIDENLIRNELTELEQGVAVARRKEIYEARFPETKHGGDRKSASVKSSGHDVHLISATFADDTATKTDQSARQVRRQVAIGEGLKDIADEVAATSIADNQKELLALAKLPELEQRQVVAALTSGEATSVKQAYRQQTAATIKTSPPAFPQGPFSVLVVDPPWTYDNRGNDKSHRAANPYPSMSLADIAALPIRALSTPDAILWLWTTNAHLPYVFDLVEGWGFTYKTLLTWAKSKMGLGDWLRGQTEHCVMAIRGKPLVTLTNQTTLLQGPLRAHSEKPDEFFALVDALCPTVPGGKCELFARQSRPGWQQWGAELREAG